MHNHRRRKKRPNYGTRSVDVLRGINGFGFTISGQQPCILSCIVANSPADLAGLRAGDFLISVNGFNVSKLPHEAVVQLIGSTIGTIRVSIAENYYSDSSDDENHSKPHQTRIRPKYPNKFKLAGGRPPHQPTDNVPPHQLVSPMMPSIGVATGDHSMPSSGAATAHSVIHSPNASCNSNVLNVSAMVRPYQTNSVTDAMHRLPTNNHRTGETLEYSAIVGYLGTIEMPKQIATSSKLQMVRSCIRKIRQEKRNPTIVLMTIFPNCLTLRNNANVMLAKYPSNRLSYISSNSDKDNRFFGLVTTAVYANGLMCEPLDKQPSGRNDVVISNSCHVFVIDSKLTEHANHVDKAEQFNITCTMDPISNLCLEFPNNSEYVVNLIRSMYTLKLANRLEYSNGIVAMSSRSANQPPGGGGAVRDDMLLANSPQPSEITTTSSNSDSGIGFHNDCINISDRILVVDFPVVNHHHHHHHHHVSASNVHGMRQPNALLVQQRPTTIINDSTIGVDSVMNIRSRPTGQIGVIGGASMPSPMKPLQLKSKSMDMIMPDWKCAEMRLNVRATVDTAAHNDVYQPDFSSSRYETVFGRDVVVNGGGGGHICDSTSFNSAAMPCCSRTVQLAARSCDNIMMTFGRDSSPKQCETNHRSELDDVRLLGEAPKPPSHTFISPKPVRKKKKQYSENVLATARMASATGSDAGGGNQSRIDKLMCYKLSPKVYDVYKPESLAEVCEREDSERERRQSLGVSSENSASVVSLEFSHFGSGMGYSSSMKATYSEPDLPSHAGPNNVSPFRRWGQSSFRSRPNEPKITLQRRPSSLAASESDVYLKSIDDIGGGTPLQSRDDVFDETPNCRSVTTWGSSFEKLLEDTAGLHTFAEFLKKEFSAENIYFWTSCERYRQLNDTERAKEAIVIFSKHLGVGAAEPVNVDSQARNTAQDNLSMANKDLFKQAQKQIFNLMKFDSYQRFIRSDLYKSCLEAEANNKPLPYPGDTLDIGLHTGGLHSPVAAVKIKKSLSNAEDRRRKSLLPWHRKARCKSKDRADEVREKQAIAGSASNISTHSASDIHSSRSSLSSFDVAISSRIGGPNDSDETKSTLCRVMLNDGATTIVQTRPNESVRELVDRLLEKRGIFYQAFEAFFPGNSKAIDLDEASVMLAGKEVTIEQRVVFKLDLPNRKVISVKSKTCKALGEVLRPILHKYNYRLDLVQVLQRDSSEPLNMTHSVTITDGQRLQVVCKSSEADCEVQPIVVLPKKALPEPGSSSYIPMSTNVLQLPNLLNVTSNTFKSRPVTVKQQQSTLDEITNQVYSELLQEKVESHAHHNPNHRGGASDTGSMRSGDWGSTKSGSGMFGRLKPRPDGATLRAKALIEKISNTGSDEDIKKPLIAKWKTGVKLQVTSKSENHELLEGLKRAQRSRLEDQRGTEINFELPDFLKDKEIFNINKLRIIKTAAEPIPLSRSTTTDAVPSQLPLLSRPQPAPRLSILKNTIVNNSGGSASPSPDRSPSKHSEQIDPILLMMRRPSCGGVGENMNSIQAYDALDVATTGIPLAYNAAKGPPPLPPKPKILPIKPSNWGQSPKGGGAAEASSWH